MKGWIVYYVASRGYLLTPAAERYLEGMDEALLTGDKLDEFVERIPGAESIVDIEDLRKAISPPGEVNIATSLKNNKGEMEEARTIGELPSPPLIKGDISGNSLCSGEIDDFMKYIRDRYERLSAILKKSVSSSVSIEAAKRRTSSISIIGMVRETKTTKNGHIIVDVEDMSDHIPVLIKKDSDMISENFLLDEVIAFSGSTSMRGDMFYADSLTRPEAVKKPGLMKIESENEVAIISDIHVGSNTFLPDAWKRFVKWLGSKDAQSVKYLLIAGDLVDGIGIYPNQEKELEITDIYEQYAHLAELIREIPSDIRIIMQPGNHDAVRPAEPQPLLPEKIRKLFSEDVVFTGNPVYVNLEGRLFLSYHGRSMDDILSSVRGLSYETPLLAMKEMLKRRLLAPSYGQKTPLAPESTDYMLIDPVPDVLVTGHVHSYGVAEFNGITLINSSTWQSQTEYQKMHNFHPQPARVAVYHLGTGKVRDKNFLEA